MIELLSQAIAQLGSLVKKIGVTSLLAAGLVGLILLTSSPSYAAQGTTKNVDSDVLESSNPERPTNKREWEQQASRTEDAPLERLKEIGKESVEAVKDMGGMYKDNAKRTAPDELADS
ncbi:hypothetical protein [Myxosarcina sp. GI1]|uniref:hypothetical protein n=1 Tax=Myxosarcina sp. GI1 TaxID=1541065 RepID=UPI0006922200|nr:hypothetical protein [Myxosarcina sp. GI1]